MRGSCIDRGSLNRISVGNPGRIAEAHHFVGPLVLEDPQLRSPEPAGTQRAPSVHRADSVETWAWLHAPQPRRTPAPRPVSPTRPPPLGRPPRGHAFPARGGGVPIGGGGAGARAPAGWRAGRERGGEQRASERESLAAGSERGRPRPDREPGSGRFPSSRSSLRAAAGRSRLSALRGAGKAACAEFLSPVPRCRLLSTSPFSSAFPPSLRLPPRVTLPGPRLCPPGCPKVTAAGVAAWRGAGAGAGRGAVCSGFSLRGVGEGGGAVVAAAAAAAAAGEATPRGQHRTGR